MEKYQRDNYRNLDIAELIQKCQQDDKFALEELVRRQEKNVYAAFYYLDPKRADIADLTQEALLRMARGIKKLRNIATFKYWLNQIITNLFYDELRKKTKRLNTVSMDAPIGEGEEDSSPTRDIADAAQQPEETSLYRELDKIIKNGIENLPEQFRLVIVLRELQGLSYDEIAHITQTEIGTVKSRIARARTKLQEYIRPYLT